MADNPTVRYHLGMAYYKNGEKENGRMESKKALELNPKFSGSEEAKTVLGFLGSLSSLSLLSSVTGFGQKKWEGGGGERN